MMKGRRLPKVMPKKRPGAGAMPPPSLGAMPAAPSGGMGGAARLPQMPMPRKGM